MATGPGHIGYDVFDKFIKLLYEEIMGACFAPLLVISGAKLYFLGAVLPFALCVSLMLHLLCEITTHTHGYFYRPEHIIQIPRLCVCVCVCVCAPCGGARCGRAGVCGRPCAL